MEDMMGSQSMMNTNLPYGSLLSGLLVLLIKFLILLLIVSIIIGIGAWVKNNFFKEINVTKLMNQNPMVKLIIGILAALLGLVFIIYIFSYLTGNRTLLSYGSGMYYGMGTMNGYYGSSFGLVGIIMYLLKALIYVFSITLVIGVIAYVVKLLGLNNIHPFNTNNNKNNQAQNNPSMGESTVNNPDPINQENESF